MRALFSIIVLLAFMIVGLATELQKIPSDTEICRDIVGRWAIGSLGTESYFEDRRFESIFSVIDIRTLKKVRVNTYTGIWSVTNGIIVLDCTNSLGSREVVRRRLASIDEHTFSYCIPTNGATNCNNCVLWFLTKTNL